MAIQSICDKTLCTGCSTCCQVCPQAAITMDKNSEGFLYPTIHNHCVECGLCIKMCPINSQVSKNPATFYMGWHKDLEILKKSSSGGFFSILAEYVIARGGVVFGAVKNQKNEIIHTYVESMAEMDPLRLSKYYQSNVLKTYRVAKNFLLSNRMVLFTGTACQIAGLRNYLGKEYDHLLTMDVLCHGVASKKVVDAFIKSKEKQFKKRITDFHFRVKEEKRGWYNGGGTRMHLYFEDGSEAVEPGKYDTFFLGFNNNYFLRESCYHCKFCGTDRVSDITLADYWKCDHPEISEEQKKLGVALILANTELGKKILTDVKRNVEIFEIDGNDAILHNRALVQPQERPELRDHFYSLLKTKDYDQIIHGQFKSRFLKRRIKRCFKHIIPSALYYKIFKD